MNRSTMRIPASLMRGGSSKGVFFLDQDLPADSGLRKQIFLAAIGSPDPYGSQMDGLGGATSSTSKVVVISRSGRADCDIDYYFGHVSVQQPVVDETGNCGNLSAAAGVFAIESGLVPPASGMTSVRVWQINTGQKMVIHVPTDGDDVITYGDYEVAGVSGSGAPVRVEFIAGTGIRRRESSLLADGVPAQPLVVPGVGEILVSLVNAANPMVFVRPADIGLKGDELPSAVNADPDRLEYVERIRRAAAVAMGVCDAPEDAASRPGTPKIAMVRPPLGYITTAGVSFEVGAMDLCARIFSMGRMHHAYTGTGAVATAVAAAIPGSVVYDCVTGATPGQANLKIGHAAGVMDADCVIRQHEEGWSLVSSSFLRTARTLMRGEILIPCRHLGGPEVFDSD